MFMWFSVTETYRWSAHTSSLFVIYWCWHIFVWKIFYDFNTAFDYLLMLTYFSCAKCSYHSWLMFMWFSVTETYQWSGWTSSSFVIDIFFVWKVFYDSNTACDYLLMLTYFSCAKCSYHFHLIFMWFSVTETYQWSARTSCWFFIYWYWHIFCVENILEFMWFSVTETHWWSGWTSSSFVIDIFLCGKYFTISILLLIIYWCWHIFMLKMLHNFNIVFDYLLILTIFHVPKFVKESFLKRLP